MRSIARIRTLPPWRILMTNYIGGLAYYAWHFAWILTVFFAALRLLQYLVFGGQPLLYTPAQTVQTTAIESAEIGIVATIFASVLTVILCVAVVMFVVYLPYLIGYISRDVPRWCLRQTSWQITKVTLYRAKIIGTIAVLICAIPALYYPGGSAYVNIGFFVVSAACVAACVGFWLQHLCATLWDIPERRVF